MENIFDILIPILMFAVPIGAAIADNRKKEREKAARKVVSHTLTEEEIKAILDPESRVTEEKPAETLSEPSSWQPAFSLEGQKAIDRKIEPVKPIELEEEKRDRLQIDRKKLILYSEIMKPKFDE